MAAKAWESHKRKIWDATHAPTQQHPKQLVAAIVASCTRYAANPFEQGRHNLREAAEMCNENQQSVMQPILSAHYTKVTSDPDPISTEQMTMQLQTASNVRILSGKLKKSKEQATWSTCFCFLRPVLAPCCCMHRTFCLVPCSFCPKLCASMRPSLCFCLFVSHSSLHVCLGCIVCAAGVLNDFLPTSGVSLGLNCMA